MRNTIHGCLLALGVLLMGACQKDKPAGGATAPVTVTFSDFSITTGNYDDGKPTKDAVAGYSGVKAMTLAFFDAQGNAVYNATQLRADGPLYSTASGAAFTLTTAWTGDTLFVDF